jgi:DNA-directed RNA polymerase
MAALQYEVKKEFILLYTQHNFLETFHNRMLQSIQDNNLDVIGMDEIAKQGYPCFILHMGEKIEIPQLPKIGNLDLEDVKYSTYMIS